MMQYIKKLIPFGELKKLITVIFDQGFVSLSTFLITVVIANNFDKIDYANFVLLTSIAMTILGFQRSIITQPLAINYSDYSETIQQKYFNYNVFLKNVFNLLLVVVFLIYLFFNKDYNDNLSKESILFFYVFAFTSYFFVKDMYIGSRQTKTAFYYGIFVSILIFILLSIVYTFQFIGLLSFLFILSIIYLLPFVIMFLVNNNKKAIKYNYSFKDGFLSNNWRVGKWIAATNLLYSIYSQAGPWIILYFLSKDEVAIYGILISVTNLVSPVLRGFTSYMLPLLASYRSQMKELIKQFIFWEIIFITTAVLFLIFGVIFGEWLVSFVFGSKYANLGWIVVLPFINQSINIIFQPVDIILNALKRTDIGFYLVVFRAIFSLLLAYVFVSNFGLIGIFVARIIENLFYQLILFNRMYKLMTI